MIEQEEGDAICVERTMKYHWGEWSLDREAGLLKHRGRAVDASRKVLECMDHLISHRERVVGYDELIRKVWGHEDVANNRLSQLIVSIRRLLGDDGHAQRFIRTAPGLGYQWIGTLDDGPAEAHSAAPDAVFAPALSTTGGNGATETAHDSLQRHASAATSAPTEPASQPGAPAVGSRSKTIRVAVASMLLVSTAVAGFMWQTMNRPSSPAAAAATPVKSSYATSSIQSLELAMRAGEFETVRDGLAALPAPLAESPDAMIIAMRLDGYRGRYERAKDKLDAQLALARSVDDPIWQAKLLVFQAFLQGRMGASAAEREATIDAALDLLEPLGEDSAPEVLADALRSRAAILLLKGAHEESVRDLNRSAQIYARIGDARSAVGVRTDRARIWMRTGRLEDALRTMHGVADDYQTLSDKIGAVAALNTMSRIQMELLLWNEAMQTSDRALALMREVPEIERRDRVLQLRAQAMTRLGRLRQARALLEEVGALDNGTADSMIGILFLLEAGDNTAALNSSATLFAQNDRDDPDDILLETREGALLTWMIAAHGIANSGGATPTPSSIQIDALRNPRSVSGTIASAYWAILQDESERAESLLTQALAESKRKGMRYHMLLATEPLFDLLLRQGYTQDAKRLIDDVRAHDRERMDQDFRFLLLRWRLKTATGNTREANAVLVKLRNVAGERAIPGQAGRRSR